MFFTMAGFNIYLDPYIVDIPVPLAYFCGGYGEIRCSGKNPVWPPIRGEWGGDCQAPCLSCVGKKFRSSISRQSTRTCSQFLMLYNTVLRHHSHSFPRNLAAAAYFYLFWLRLQWNLVPALFVGTFCIVMCLPLFRYLSPGWRLLLFPPLSVRGMLSTGLAVVLGSRVLSSLWVVPHMAAFLLDWNVLGPRGLYSTHIFRAPRLRVLLGFVSPGLSVLIVLLIAICLFPSGIAIYVVNFFRDLVRFLFRIRLACGVFTEYYFANDFFLRSFCDRFWCRYTFLFFICVCYPPFVYVCCSFPVPARISCTSEDPPCQFSVFCSALFRLVILSTFGMNSPSNSFFRCLSVLLLEIVWVKLTNFVCFFGLSVSDWVLGEFLIDWVDFCWFGLPLAIFFVSNALEIWFGLLPFVLLLFFFLWSADLVFAFDWLVCLKLSRQSCQGWLWLSKLTPPQILFAWDIAYPTDFLTCIQMIPFCFPLNVLCRS